MPEHMSVVGVDIIIAIEPVSECTVQLLMPLSYNSLIPNTFLSVDLARKEEVGLIED